jgi:hypothetical protein
MDISGLDELDVRDVRLTNNENNTDVSLIQFKKNRGGNGSAGQDGDPVGKISFVSYNDAGTPEEITYGVIQTDISDASDGTEGGKIALNVATEDGLKPGVQVIARSGAYSDTVDVTLGNSQYCSIITPGDFSANTITMGGGYSSTGTSIGSSGAIQSKQSLTCSAITLDTTTITASEIGVLDSVTPGTAAASKAVVLDGSSNISGIGTVGCGAITTTATQTITSEESNDFVALKLTNQNDANDTTGSVSLQFDLEDTSGNTVDAGKITVKKNVAFTSTSTTQDSNMVFSTSLNGTITEQMAILSNGNVGIGTTDPSNRLQVVKSTDNSNAIAEFIGGSTGNNANFISVKNPDEDAIAVFGCCPDNVDDGGIGICNSSTSGSGNINFYRQDGSLNHLMTITEDGNVGIGTDNPQGKLHVLSDDNINSGSNFNDFVAPLVIRNSTSTHAMMIDTNQIEQKGDSLFLNNTSTENVCIANGGGKVGIGTNNPAEILEIKGSDATFTPDNYGDIFRIYGSDAHIQVGSDDAGGYGSSLLLTTGLKTWSMNSRGTGASQRFSINLTNHANTTPVDALSGNSEYFTIDTSGLVGIGTNNPLGKLHVEGTGSAQSVSYGFLNSSGSTGTGSGNIDYSIWVNWRIAANEFNAVSDDRLKIQEEYITDATTTLMKLRPQNYYKKNKLDTVFQLELDEWNTKKGDLQVKINDIETIPEVDRTEEQISNLAMYKQELEELENNEPTNDAWLESGLIAQEVFYDAPELRHIVTTGINPQEIPDTPPEGYDNPDPSIDPDYSNWGESAANLKYNNFIAYLIKGFQEQQAIITDLQTRIDLLENTF